MKPLFTLVLLFGALLIGGQASAADGDDDAARLKQLKQDIAQLQQWLNEATEEFSELSRSLQSTDQEIGELSRQIRQTRQQLEEEQERLKKLRQDQAQLDELRQGHLASLKQQLLAAHRLGNNAPIKALLNQDDPQQAQRMLRYLEYFSQARQQAIQHAVAELKRLDRIAEAIVEQEQQLQSTQAQLQQRNQTLASRKQQQQTLLTKLNQQMADEQQRLQQKQADRKRLESLLDEVRTLVERSPRRNDARKFASLKRQLPPPLAGRVMAAYGSPVRDGAGHWEGWLIAAPEGQAVRAVHHGRVVYSDWLRGFGLLLIIDHGDGYMTLYAHNQSLMFDVGEWVNRGDVVSLVGRSGGLTEPRLYFEIRYQGRPQDPAAWLARP